MIPLSIPTRNVQGPIVVHLSPPLYVAAQKCVEADDHIAGMDAVPSLDRRRCKVAKERKRLEPMTTSQQK